MQRLWPRTLLAIGLGSSLVAGQAGAACDPSGASSLYDPFGFVQGAYMVPKNGFTPICSYLTAIPPGQKGAASMRAYMTKAQFQECMKRTKNGTAPQSIIAKRLTTNAQLEGFQAGFRGYQSWFQKTAEKYPVAYALVKISLEEIPGLVSKPWGYVYTGLNMFITATDMNCKATDVEKRRGDLATLVERGGRVVYEENLVQTAASSSQGARYSILRMMSYQIDIGSGRDREWLTKIVPLAASALPVEIK